MITQRQATLALYRKQYRFRDPSPSHVNSPIREAYLDESSGATVRDTISAAGTSVGQADPRDAAKGC